MIPCRFGQMRTDGELAYVYDKNGNRTQVTYPGDLKTTSTFDRMDREASLTLQQGAGPVTTVVSPGAAYKAFGPLASMVHPTATQRTVTRDYDQRYAPTAITVSANQLTWSYTVDAAGNPTAISQSQPSAVNRDYGYQDVQYYLTSAAGPWIGPLRWSYDRIGNRLSETRNSITDAYSYESNSGVTGNTARLDLVTLGIGGTRDYGFYAGGFLDLVDLGANVVDFTFDVAGQLARSERAVAAESADFRYDGRGFLRQVTASMPGSGGPPGGDLPFLDGFESGDVCAWSEAIGAVGTGCPETVQQTLTALYDSAGNLHALESETADPRRVLYFAGSPIAIYNAGPVPELTILTTDHLGTPIRAMDQAGTTTWLGGFEPFGREFTTPTADESGVFLRLPGQWSDGVWEGATLGAGMYYNLHRWYEPGTARYASTDPLKRGLAGIGVGIRKFAELPEYGYAFANPIRFADPLGLCSSCDQCPSGQWYYNGVGFTLAAGFGFGRSWGTFTCIGNERVKVDVTTSCAYIGAIAVVGAGGETNPSGGSACACNSDDFFGPDGEPVSFGGSYATAGPFSVGQVPPGECGNVQRTYGVSKSWGLGGAYMDCTMEPRQGFSF